MSASSPFERIGIVGLGLIGGSVALAIRRRWPEVALSACDRPEVLASALAGGIVDEGVTSVIELPPLDLIVVATPVQRIPQVLAELAGAACTALVTDVASTKRRVMEAAAGTSLRFIGGHPMAGAETSGLTNARADLFDARPWLLVSPSEPAAEDATRLEAFCAGLGAAPVWTDAETHDRVMAYVSHAPQLLSTALMAAAGGAVGEEGLAWSGRGFADMTRLAASSSEMWQGILETNADFIAEALAAVSAQLPSTKH